MNDDNDQQFLRAALQLMLADGVGSILFGRIEEYFGDIAAALENSAELAQVKGLGKKTLQSILSVTDKMIDDEIALAARRSVQILSCHSDSYPAALKYIFDKPPLLYVRGNLSELDAISVAIVGSRNCSHYGVEQAGRFGSLLGRSGYTVVSGGARGIDSAAHRGAIAAGGRTIAVMGCGLATVYPPENAELFDQIANGHGAIVSEFPMKTGVQGGHFPRRNRIISGMSQGVLVVEAAQRSGSLITASLAGEQGRTVFALPGRVDSAFSRGTNELIRDGAILVQDLGDLLDGLGELGQATSESAADEQKLLTPNATLDGDEQRIVEALNQQDMSIDAISQITAIAPGPLASKLTMLTIKAVVSQLPGNIFTLKKS